VIDKRLIADCVHCGFCLPTCPTYTLLGEEMDSPRGRIHLMSQAGASGALGAAWTRHLDLCLGCLACETACPSGVRYGELLEEARHEIAVRGERPAGARVFRELLFALLPWRGRLRLLRFGVRVFDALGLRRIVQSPSLQRRLPERVRALLTLMPEARPLQELPAVTPARGEERQRAFLLTGCVQSVFFSDVNAATARVLVAEGVCVLAPPDQGCCGALSVHAGRTAEAKALARRTIEAFEKSGASLLAVNAAGCGSVLKDYGRLLRDDPAFAERASRFAASVRDVSELLSELTPRAARRPLPLKAAYHDACHLAHAQRIRKQPRGLLRAIPGLELVEVPEPDACCGSAGIYNLVEPDAARALGERKAGHVLSTGAQALVTSNPGCMLQLQAALREQGRPLPVYHVVELLDAALHATPLRPGL
jgi:glycolate oxidase iron-sulfur subunit